MAYSLVDVSVVAGALALIGFLRSLRGRTRLPLPPGPKGLPLIGNILDMPEAEEWEAARKWGEKYGPIVYVEVLGTQYIFLNSYQDALELLEKRGSNYSSRPKNVMLELEGFSDWFPAVMPYGDDLKKSRQMMHRFLQPAAVGDYLDIQAHSTYKLLEGLLNTPEKFFDLIRFSAGETIMMMAYGHKVADKNDPFVELGEKAMEAFAEAEGFFLVNACPWLRYLPEWFPGAGFKTIAKNGYVSSMAMYQKPHEMTKKKMLSGEALPSMTTKLMEANMGKDGVIKDEALIAKTTGITYGGGAGTTVSALSTFLLAMVLYPEVQKRAQEELERVVGKSNLPSFDDRPNLPYIDAIVKECLRWQTVGPMGVAHTAAENDEYKGYHIPAGATILSNIWAMSRDPTFYDRPDEFIPERWIPTDGRKPPLDSYKLAFGFGRRICPGRYFADNSMFFGVACILSAFNISKAVDEHGVPITPSGEYTPHFIRHPKPFKYSITPRSTEIVKNIRQFVESSK